jgi:hypothetical protein
VCPPALGLKRAGQWIPHMLTPKRSAADIHSRRERGPGAGSRFAPGPDGVDPARARRGAESAQPRLTSHVRRLREPRTYRRSLNATENPSGLSRPVVGRPHSIVEERCPTMPGFDHGSAGRPRPLSSWRAASRLSAVTRVLGRGLVETSPAGRGGGERPATELVRIRWPSLGLSGASLIVRFLDRVRRAPSTFVSTHLSARTLRRSPPVKARRRPLEPRGRLAKQRPSLRACADAAELRRSSARKPSASAGSHSPSSSTAIGESAAAVPAHSLRRQLLEAAASASSARRPARAGSRPRTAAWRARGRPDAADACRCDCAGDSGRRGPVEPRQLLSQCVACTIGRRSSLGSRRGGAGNTAS